MKRFRSTTMLGLALGASLLSGCGSDESERDGLPPAEGPGAPESVAESNDAALGALRGVVRDARTDRPVLEALVSAGAFGTTTDAQGAYLVSGLSPGPVKVHAYRRGFRPESTTVVVAAGSAVAADLPLVPAEPPCCSLEGEWSGRFELDSAGLNARPSARSVDGGLTFGTDDADADPEARVASSTGSSDVDFARLLGGDVRGSAGDLEGVVFAGDSVAITLLPRFGDWAVELRGRQAADTLRGSWFQRASCCGAYGHFVLVREKERAGGRGS